MKFFSVDKAGNAEGAKSQLIQVDGTPATTTIRCNGGACSTGWYTATVPVTLPATDAGGSGVGATYYTTDGSTPTTPSTRYTGAFTVAQTRTVKYFSVDTAGNSEGVSSQQIRLDGTAPVTTIQCNGGTCPTTTYSDGGGGVGHLVGDGRLAAVPGCEHPLHDRRVDADA